MLETNQLWYILRRIYKKLENLFVGDNMSCPIVKESVNFIVLFSILFTPMIIVLIALIIDKFRR